MIQSQALKILFSLNFRKNKYSIIDYIKSKKGERKWRQKMKLRVLLREIRLKKFKFKKIGRRNSDNFLEKL